MLGMASKRRTKVDISELGRPTLTMRETAEVFGVSRATIWRRHGAGRLWGVVRYYETRGGWKFDMEDVFEAAYPCAQGNAEVLASLMLDFREKKRRR